MIEGDTEAMTTAEYIKFEATNKQKFQKRKHSRDGGIQRRDGKIAPPPPVQNQTDEL